MVVWYWDENFPYPNGASFACSRNHSTENGSHHWTRSRVHWWNHFQFFDHVVCEISSSAPRMSPSFSDWHTWISYEHNLTAFVNHCNYVLDVFYCWDSCWVEVVSWSLILKECAHTTPVAVSNNYDFLSRPIASCIPANIISRFKSGHQPINNEKQYKIISRTSAIWWLQNHSDFLVLITYRTITTSLDVIFFPNSEQHASQTLALIRLFSCNFLMANSDSLNVSDSIFHFW